MASAKNTQRAAVWAHDYHLAWSAAVAHCPSSARLSWPAASNSITAVAALVAPKPHTHNDPLFAVVCQAATVLLTLEERGGGGGKFCISRQHPELANMRRDMLCATTKGSSSNELMPRSNCNLHMRLLVLTTSGQLVSRLSRARRV